MRTPKTAFSFIIVVVFQMALVGRPTQGRLENVKCNRDSNVLIIEGLSSELNKIQQEIWARTTESHCVSYYQEHYHDSSNYARLSYFPWINEVEVYFIEQELHHLPGTRQLRIVYDHAILYPEEYYDDDGNAASSSCDVIDQNAVYFFSDPLLLAWDKYSRNLQSALKLDSNDSNSIVFVSLDTIGDDLVGGFFDELKTNAPTSKTKPPQQSPTPSSQQREDNDNVDDDDGGFPWVGVLLGMCLVVTVAFMLLHAHLVSKRKVEATLCNVVGESSYALKNVPNDLKNDKEFIKKAVSKNGLALEHAPTSMKNVKNIVLAAVGNNGLSLQHASETLKADIDIVLAAVKQDGNSLRYASPSLRADKKCVTAAVSNKPESLQFALRILNQDKDLLIAAGIWDKDHKQLCIADRKSTRLNSSHLA